MNRTLIFAVLGALGTALLVALLLASSGDKKTPVTEILVADKNLSIGTILDNDGVRWQKWPNGETVSGALVRDKIKEDDWKNQKVRRAIAKGEPITEGALIKEVKGGYLAAALEPGMRAMAIDVKANSGVAGFVYVGDHVDVILTYQTHINQNGDQPFTNVSGQDNVMERASETIIQNVRVLATDQDTPRSSDNDHKAKVSKTVTLEVSPKQAEQLALATQMGELYLVLRQLGDTSDISDKNGITTDMTTAHILQKAAHNVNNPTNTIHVYTAQGVQEVKVLGARHPTGGSQ